MGECVRAGCAAQALAPWWLLCAGCTRPLLERVDEAVSSAADQQSAAGWEAVDWAERIAPARWGHAVLSDPWVTTVRCLVFASVVTGRVAGCPHTGAPSSRPVVAVPRSLDILACPSCAEPVVARTTVDGGCDRCRQRPTGPPDRVALISGSSLIVVGQLCPGCAYATLELVTGTTVWDT